MKYIQLVHDKRLGLAPENEVMSLNIEKIKGIKADFLLTFRKISKDYEVKYERNVHACKRFINKYKGNIVCYALENDSPVAPIILWDIVHTMPIGCTISMLGEGNGALYLGKDYFKGSMRTLECDNLGGVVFEKIKKLPAEQDAGMDKWTFGIPVGPDDATLLNSLIERILSFDDIEKEIVLCGKPGKNFKYRNNVRIVGEDIPAPPVQISKKKNLIIKEAKYNNLCILHDRVMLPVDFISQMRRYGDYYSFTTLQSMYFDDYYNFVPIRYSDYNAVHFKMGVSKLYQVSENMNVDIVKSLEAFFSAIEKQGFVYASPLNYSCRMYPTGSLYILKKSVGLTCLLNENLAWEQFEDVEYGMRMNERGIITRVNPYTFSQSMTVRATVVGGYGNVFLNASNVYGCWESRRHIALLKYKPLFKMNEEKAWDNFDKFRRKYCENVFLQRGKITASVRRDTINKLLMNAKFNRTKEAVSEFVRDVGTLLFLNRITYTDEEHYTDLILKYPDDGKYKLGIHYEYMRHYILRKRGKLFYDSMYDYYVKKTIWVKIGSYLSALHMNKMQGSLYYHPDGVRGFYRAIINSSLWKEK